MTKTPFTHPILLLLLSFFCGCQLSPSPKREQTKKTKKEPRIIEAPIEQVKYCQFIGHFSDNHEIGQPGRESLELAKKEVLEKVKKNKGSHVVWTLLNRENGAHAKGNGYQCDLQNFRGHFE